MANVKALNNPYGRAIRAGMTASGVLGIVLLVSCQSPRWRMLADETLFPKGLVKTAEDSWSKCPEQLKDNFEKVKAIDPNAKYEDLTLTAINAWPIPEQHRPALSDIERKYGKADRVDDGVHYWGDVGLRPQGGKVEALVIRCESKPVGASR